MTDLSPSPSPNSPGHPASKLSRADLLRNELLAEVNLFLLCHPGLSWRSMMGWQGPCPTLLGRIQKGASITLQSVDRIYEAMRAVDPDWVFNYELDRDLVVAAVAKKGLSAAARRRRDYLKGCQPARLPALHGEDIRFKPTS